MTNPFKQYGLTEDDAHDALADVSRMLTGSKMLQDEPGIVYDLAAAKATPQDAQSIDQFMQTLDAERKVQIARAVNVQGGGGYINLSPAEQKLLASEGFAYNDVLFSHSADAAQQAAKVIQAQSGGALTAKTNPDGTLTLDAKGNIQTTRMPAPPEDDGGGGFFGAVGGALGAVGGAFKTAGVSTWHGLNKAYNFTQAGLTGEYANKLPGHEVLDVQDNVLHADATRRQDMLAQGYDPDSLWSTFAFGASGHAHSDLSALNDKFGEEQVNAALRFLKDPKSYKDEVFNDPNNWTTNLDGQPELSKDGKSKLDYIDSPEFADLAKRVSARDATIGNGLMNDLGVDPVHDAGVYALGSAGTNIVASFLIDPTLIAFQGIKVAKLAAVGIDSLGDADKAASILTRNSKLPWVNNVQRGWTKAIDLGAQMREAHAAGDTVELAKLNAQFTAELPGLAPLAGEFSGLGRFRFVADEAAERGYRAETFVDSGITDLAQAATWVKSKEGLNLLREGRAATQSGVMPGALSAFGYRKVKGALAGWMTFRSATRAEKAYTGVVTAATADPALGERLISDGVLHRLLPEADDAVGVANDQVLADRRALEQAQLDREAGYEVPEGESPNFFDELVSQSRSDLSHSEGVLASARRASEANGPLEATFAGKGSIQRSLRGGKTGTALDELTKVSSFGALAIGRRSRLAAQRFSTLLPRNTLIETDNTDSADKVLRYAMTYLHRGDANTFRALWVAGDEASRKQLVHGLLDQVAHAAGMGRTQSGRNFIDAMHTAQEAYSAAGEELVVNGQRMALTQGQTQTRWILPSFTALRKHAARLGLFDATFGRAASAKVSDDLMAYWKSAMLIAPKTAPRNMIEGWMRAAVDGAAGPAVKAKAVLTARNKELWQMGLERTNPRVAEAKAAYDEAVALGDTAKAKEIANSQMLAGDELGKSRLTYKLSDLAPLSLIGRSYRALNLRHMSEDEVNAILNIGPDKLAELARGYHARILESDLGLRNAAKQSTAVAKAGFGPATLGHAVKRAKAASSARDEATDKITSWTHEAISGVEGAARYANELARRANAMPDTTAAILDHLEGKGDISAVISAMERESHNTSFGKVFFEDPEGHPNVARWAVSDEERAAGKQPFARKVVREFEYLVTGRNGKYQQKLADFMRDNRKAPSDNWIVDHLTGDNRPEAALHAEVIALPNGGTEGLAQSLQDTTGAAFQWIVERTIQRTTSMPIYMANYATERVGLNKQVDRLVAEGFSERSANNFAEDLAMRRAFVRTEQIIDDPGQKTQFDVIARNFFPWSRAVNAMVRRWGAGLWQNPANARRLMLSYEGAVHAGLFYNNVYGEPTFTYPGSGVLAMVMHEVAKVPGFGGIAQFPLATDMTGNVIMSVPGADNPLRFSMGPMASIPLREVYKHLLPTSWRGEAMSLDEFMNGPIGVGDTFSQLVPSYARRFYDALQPADKNASVSSSVNGAIAYLAAAGYVPATDATHAELDKFRTRVQTQVKNQLFIRAIFGLFAPSAPSSPTEETPGTGADFAWQIDGIKLLGDEYKSILDETHGDVARATAIFTYLHPDEVVYKGGEKETKLPSALTVGKSESVTPGAYLPSTESAFRWMNKHADFIGKYKSVSAYFLPESSIEEPFSDSAYKAQIEFGLRVRKAPEQFLNDIYTRHAESGYYSAAAEFDRRIAAAKLAGDDNTSDYWTQAKSSWEKEYKALNPRMDEKYRQDGYGPALDQLKTLKTMLGNGDVPSGLAPKVNLLVQAFDRYETFIHQHDSDTTVDTEARAQAFDTFNVWAQNTISGTPLVDLYNGVFRQLNTNLDRLS